MTLASFDAETYKKDEEGNYKPILDATGEYFILGSVVKEGKKGKVFYNKNEMWEYIKKCGASEVKRDKKLTLYGHNTKYDYFNVVDWKDRNLRIFSEDPFIASYYYKVEREFDKYQKFLNWSYYAKKNNINYKIIFESKELDLVKIEYNREGIKFLDTISLFGMSLKDLGKLIGFEKGDMPLELGKKLTQDKLKILGDYCKNDCRISIEAVRFIQRRLKEDGINIRNLCTINQVAISYIINKLSQNPKNEHILEKTPYGLLSEYTHKTNFASEIHSAYRGNVRVWKVGKFNNVMDIDANSLYPTAITKMRFPDLRTEKLIEHPKVERVINEIGISRALVYNENDELGFLQIRMEKKSYVPKTKKYLIGTWTNLELKKALEIGYKIIDIEWSVIWKEGENTLKEIHEELYKKRKQSNTDFDNYFYKMIMVASIGKFGQTKSNQEILVDSIEEINNYIQRNYKILNGIEGSTDIMYINDDLNKGQVKKYYAPIIPCLITATSRVLMYDAYKKIPLDKIIYSDTDSIICIGDYSKSFDIGDDLGQWKIEKDKITKEPLINAEAIIWGTKTKRVGNNMAMSGVYKSSLNKKDFDEGNVIATKMMGIKNNRNEDVGKFIIEQKDLKVQMENFIKTEEILEKEMLYIDKDIQDIGHFAKELKRLDILHV